MGGSTVSSLRGVKVSQLASTDRTDYSGKVQKWYIERGCQTYHFAGGMTLTIPLFIPHGSMRSMYLEKGIQIY